MSFDRRKHEGKKPWEVAPFDKLHAVQIYKSGGLCEGCMTPGSKILYATDDNQALDLCLGCSEDAFAAGAFSDRFHIENFDLLNSKWYAARNTWHKLTNPKDGIHYPQVRG
jgi:hypothetical protein